MVYVITEGCVDVKDKTCLLNCPVDCIYEGDRMSYIHPDECIDCGACEPVCPQDAIYFISDLPEQLGRYAAVNAEFFAEVGSPGSSTEIDVTDRDHPLVVNLPSRAERERGVNNTTN